MNSISFTGPVDPPLGFYEIVYNTILDAAGGCGEFHYGGAFGVDTAAAKIATALYPEAVHVLHAPDGLWWNKGLLSEVDFDIIRYIPGGYMARNDSLVEDAGRLFAFPATATEVLRSGTWATVRRARKAGVPVLLTPLS